jgi:hypothetical protein
MIGSDDLEDKSSMERMDLMRLSMFLARNDIKIRWASPGMLADCNRIFVYIARDLMAIYKFSIILTLSSTAVIVKSLYQYQCESFHGERLTPFDLGGGTHCFRLFILSFTSIY